MVEPKRAGAFKRQRRRQGKLRNKDGVDDLDDAVSRGNVCLYDIGGTNGHFVRIDLVGRFFAFKVLAHEFFHPRPWLFRRERGKSERR